MEYLRSIIVDEETPAADGTYTYDLPVNPLSHLILSMLCLNDSTEASPEQIADMLTNVHVMHRGTTVFQMRGRDLYAFDQLFLGRTPIVENQVAADGSVRSLGMLLPFGRRPYMPEECFPESKAGELQIQLTVDIAATSVKTPILQLESVQLPGASPGQYMKVSTLVSTPTAVGDWDIELPIGNPYLGLLLRSNTAPATTSRTATIEAIRLLANNKEYYISSANWESLRASLINRPGLEPGIMPTIGVAQADHYALVDFDPREDSKFVLDSAALSALTLRVNAGVQDEIRVFPIELIKAA